jgi:hypothetical protein
VIRPIVFGFIQISGKKFPELLIQVKNPFALNKKSVCSFAMTNAQLKKTVREFRASRNNPSGNALAIYRDIGPVSMEMVEALVAEMDALTERMKSLEERMLDLQYRSPGAL